MKYLAFDVGGTSIKYGIVDDLGNINNQGKIKTPDNLEAMYQVMEDIYHQFRDIDGVALSMPGAVDSEVGDIKGSSALDYIHGPNIKKDLQTRLNTKVAMENDANCAALAEVWLGAGKDVDDCLFIISGTGIGGAVVKNRKIHRGIHLHGGEYGYMISLCDIDNEEFNTWSQVGSTVATVRGVAEELNVAVDSLDGKVIFDEANNNPVYQKYVNRFYYVLAIGIYNLQYAFDPEKIIIGGAISVRDDLIEQINQRLDIIFKDNPHAKVRPNVVKCTFGNDANMIGAVYHLINE